MPEYIIKNSHNIARQDWTHFVKNHLDGTVFHSPEMFETISEVAGFEPFALFAVDERGKIQAMLQGFIQSVRKGWLSSLSTRAVLVKSPLYNNPEALEILLGGLVRYCSNKSVYTEIRMSHPDHDSFNIYKRNGFQFEKRLNILVDCASEDSVRKNMSDSRKRQIRKALTAGASLNENPAESQIDEFYMILLKLYRGKARKPLPSQSFFKALYMLSINSPESLRYILVMFQNKVIGGICCPVTGNKTIHELYVAGLDSEYKELYPSVLATWGAINFAIRNKISTFDFMGAGKPEEDYGVREFKSRFGGDIIETGRFICVHSQTRMMLAKAGFRILSRLRSL